jgi:hypothetical protein
VTEIKITYQHWLSVMRQAEGFAKGRRVRADESKARLRAPTEAVRRENDIDLISGHPRRGAAARIAKKLKFDPTVREYRDSLNLPDNEHALTQWVSRILATLMK